MLSRDEVLRIAEEAGFGRLLPAFGSIPSCWHGQDIGLLEQFAALAYQRGVRDERESCAKLVESEACGGSAFNSAANYMADRIRARSAE